MFDGTQIIDTQCQPLDEHGCKVVYSEEIRPANMEKSWQFGVFRGWKT
ncbi:MAG: hypothetical protein ACLSA6_11005 [Holdemania massiliensis]